MIIHQEIGRFEASGDWILISNLPGSIYFVPTATGLSGVAKIWEDEVAEVLSITITVWPEVRFALPAEA